MGFRSRLTFLVFAAGLAALAQTPANEECSSCHEDQSKKLVGGVHASVACSQCHQKHEEYPHPANVPKPQCASCHTQQGSDYAKGVHGQAVAHGNSAAPECATCHGSAHEVLNPLGAVFRKQVPETCGMCHTDIAEQYKGSIHGQAIQRGEMNAAVCTDCHGEHAIISPKSAQSPVHGAHVRETCGQCHGNVRLARRFGMPADRIATFDQSFHGLAAAGGSRTVANCASCHGIHNILPSSDPKSQVNAANLPATCGKCHPGAGSRFKLGMVHTSPGRREPAALAWVRNFYLIAIPLTIGLMLLHNIGDWVRKMIRFHRAGPMVRAVTPSGEIRMYRFERILHALLAISFIVLAWTGLALKFPDHWWARPLQYGGDALDLRRNIHRIAAVVMMAAAVMHAVSLIVNKGLRRHWMEMIPKWRDGVDAARGFAYNLGLLKTKPKLPHHSYIEKAEYWAVVWGTAVMVISGLLLWANNLSLRFLPKWFLDVATSIHWYEAVLASLAILVWHFYSVIFDPEVYPLDTAFLTGKSPRRREPEETEEVEAQGDQQPAQPAMQ
jgi:cytochrome b subunit of formate dehydrogenase